MRVDKSFRKRTNPKSSTKVGIKNSMGNILRNACLIDQEEFNLSRQ